MVFTGHNLHVVFASSLLCVNGTIFIHIWVPFQNWISSICRLVCTFHQQGFLFFFFFLVTLTTDYCRVCSTLSFTQSMGSLANTTWSRYFICESLKYRQVVWCGKEERSRVVEGIYRRQRQMFLESIVSRGRRWVFNPKPTMGEFEEAFMNHLNPWFCSSSLPPYG